MRDPAGPHCPLGTPVRRCILTPYPAALTCAAELLGLLWYQVLDAAAVGEACVLVVGLEGLAGAVGLLRGLALFTIIYKISSKIPSEKDLATEIRWKEVHHSQYLQWLCQANGHPASPT